MKITYIIGMVILLIIGNFFRLFFEKNFLPEIEINETIVYQNEGSENIKQISGTYDINIIQYDEIIALGFTKTQVEKIIAYRTFIGQITDLNELKKIPRFGEPALKKSKKFFYISKENINQKNLRKHDINSLNEDELKLLGLQKKEIEKIIYARTEQKIRSEMDLIKLIGEEAYKKISKHIQYIKT